MTEHLSYDNELLRPGRVDVKIRIGHCSQETVAKLFSNFYQDSSVTEEQADSFARNVFSLANVQISAAQVQAFLLLHKDDHLSAIDNAKYLFTSSDLQ